MIKKLLVFFLMSFLFICPVFAGSGRIIDINSIVRIGGDVLVARGQTVNQAVAVGGDVIVNGIVMGDVVAVGGSVIVSNTAAVYGSVTSIGGNIEKDPSAFIKGSSVTFSIPAVEINERHVFSTAGLTNRFELLKGVSILAFFILCLILVYIFPGQIGKASYSIERKPGFNFLVGILCMLLVPLILFLLGITIIGIPLIPFFIIIVVASIIFGLVVISQLVGKKALGIIRIFNQPMPLEVIIGLGLIIVLGALPYCGWIFKVLFAVTGLGAAALTRFGQEVS